MVRWGLKGVVRGSTEELFRVGGLIVVPTILNQVLVLAGVIVGAAMSYLTSSLTERAKWRRAILARWDDKRLEAYSTYADAVKAEQRVTLRLANGAGAGSRTLPLASEEGIPLLADAEGRRATAFEKVLLLGTEETIRLARRWHVAVWNLQHIYRNGDGTMRVLTAEGKERFSVEYQQLVHLKDEFHLAARRDLGVSSTLPKRDPWERIDEAPV
jgi:hypothetical protein